MSSDLDQAEKIACGKWKFARDENTEEMMKDLKYPEAVTAFVMGTKPKMNLERNGDSFKMTYELVPGKAMGYTFKLGEEVDVVDDNKPPMYHNKEVFTVENGVLKIISRSQLTGELKIDTETHCVRKGNELHNLTSKIGDRTIIGNRVMVLDN